MIEALKQHNRSTTASIWSKDGVTERFETGVGLKQGCVLSPLLFSLFINNIPDVLEGGCNFGGIRSTF